MAAIVTVRSFREPGRRPAADDRERLRPRANAQRYDRNEFVERTGFLKLLPGVPWELVGQPWWYWRDRGNPAGLARWLSLNGLRGTVAADRLGSGMHLVQEGEAEIDVWWVSVGPYWVAFVVAEAPPPAQGLRADDQEVVILGYGPCCEKGGPGATELVELERRVRVLSPS